MTTERHSDPDDDGDRRERVHALLAGAASDRLLVPPWLGGYAELKRDVVHRSVAGRGTTTESRRYDERR